MAINITMHPPFVKGKSGAKIVDFSEKSADEIVVQQPAAHIQPPVPLA
jgi:hypothetical protein